MNDNIFVPKYRHIPRIQVAIGEIETNSWLINNMLLMPKHETWIRRRISIQRASGTTRIEGASLDVKAVGSLLAKGQPKNLSEDELANLNAIDAYEFIDYLSDQNDIPIDELAIRQINREFLSGAEEVLTPGVYRKGENKVGSYTPPNQGDVPTLMRAFALWLRSEDKLHPIVKAGIAHIHLVAIHPFWDGNGRTARGLATLILQRSQFHFKKLLFLDDLISTLRDPYFNAIEKTLGVQYKPGYNTTRFVKFFTNVVMMNSVEIKNMLTEWHKIMTQVRKDFEKLNLNSRLADGWAYARQNGQITRPEYIEVSGASPVTASRDLAKLVELGLLNPEGNTRARIYYPISEEPKPDEKQLTLKV